MLNRGHDFHEILDRRADGATLLDYLSRRYQHSTPAEWRRRINEHRVLVNGIASSAERTLRPGELLVWRRPPWVEPDAPRSFGILFEDEDLIAVAKPRGLPTLPGAGFLENTLLALVRQHDPRAVALHRLGRWTSGLVLFARTPRAASILAREWRAHRVDKRYRALASGRSALRQFDVGTPIGPVPYEPLGLLHAASPEGKLARSHVQVREQRADDFLAEVRIDTGRPHQIRIHLAVAGHPLVGDPLYGVGGLPRPGTSALPGDPGYLLHARSLVFEHPTKRREVRLSCTPPPDLRPATP